MEKVAAHTRDLTQANIEEIAKLFPQVITEVLDVEGNVTRAIDFDALRQELSAHVVEGPRERYRLEWPGKRAATVAANTPTQCTLRPLIENSVNFDTTKNVFIEGDNLEALKILQESYLGKVKLIYIDPPYNTGNDFIYDDDFAENSDVYLERSGQTDGSGVRLVANTDANGRFHSDWLSMIYPRLKLARLLLAQDGFICISIDDNEADNLKKVCEEVFGPRNFVGQFVWKKGGTGKNDSRFAIVEHEYILVFVRDESAVELGLDPEARATTKYSESDEFGNYSLVRLDQQSLQYSPALDYTLIGPDGVTYQLQHRDPNRPNAIWRWSQERVSANLDQLVFKDGKVYTKNYEKAGARPRSLLIEERFGVTRTGRKNAEDALGLQGAFDYPKPVALIAFLLRIVDDKQALIMDFFAGSGTTAEAVMRVNAEDGGTRRWILVQLAEDIEESTVAGKAGFATISDLAQRRIANAALKIAEADVHGAAGMDGGFRAFKVGEGSYKKVLSSPETTKQTSLAGMIDHIHEERTDMDLLTQSMLDWGLDLSLNIEATELGGTSVTIVDDGALIACFSTTVPNTTVRLIAGHKPLRAAFRDSSFANDADRINVEQIFRELSPDTQVKVI